MTDGMPTFGEDKFEEEVVKIKELILDDSKKLPPLEILIMGFLKDHCKATAHLFRRSMYRKAFIRLKHLEDLVYVTVRA